MSGQFLDLESFVQNNIKDGGKYFVLRRSIPIFNIFFLWLSIRGKVSFPFPKKLVSGFSPYASECETNKLGSFEDGLSTKITLAIFLRLQKESIQKYIVIEKLGLEMSLGNRVFREIVFHQERIHKVVGEEAKKQYILWQHLSKKDPPLPRYYPKTLICLIHNTVFFKSKRKTERYAKLPILLIHENLFEEVDKLTGQWGEISRSSSKTLLWLMSSLVCGLFLGTNRFNSHDRNHLMTWMCNEVSLLVSSNFPEPMTTMCFVLRNRSAIRDDSIGSVGLLSYFTPWVKFA